MDLDFALPELDRILKHRGIILAVEAFDYNPLIKWYRSKTPLMRTEWEKAHILSFKDLQKARKIFEVKNIKFWHLFSIAGVWVPKLLKLLNFLDKIILKIKGIQAMAWMITFEMHKRGEIK